MNSNLKVWIQEHGWRGVILVIAETESQAREMMKGHYNYDSDGLLDSHPVVEGFVYVNLGDT